MPPPSLLAVTSEPPWPLSTGGHIRTYYLAKALATRFRVRLVTGSSEHASLPDLVSEGVEPMVVRLPPRRFATEAKRVASAAVRSEPYVMYRRHDWPAIRATVTAAVKAERPDVLYLDHLDSFVYASLAPHTTCVVADLHNVYSLLALRTANEARGFRRVYLRHEARLLARFEARCARRCDVLTAVSPAEADYFRGLGGRDVRVVPNGVDCRRYTSLPLGRDSDVSTILYVGAMSWSPNANAARFLAEAVLPIVRRTLPSARLRIVGRDPLPEVAALARLPGVTVTGSVETVLPHLAEAHLLAVPLEAGGGTRLKILEAFAAGLPVVSTQVGAEGLAAQPGVHFLQAERSEFASTVLALLRDSERRRRLAAAARELVEAQYDWAAVGQRAIDAIFDGIARRPRALGDRF